MISMCACMTSTKFPHYTNWRQVDLKINVPQHLTGIRIHTVSVTYFAFCILFCWPKWRFSSWEIPVAFPEESQLWWQPNYLKLAGFIHNFRRTMLFHYCTFFSSLNHRIAFIPVFKLLSSVLKSHTQTHAVHATNCIVMLINHFRTTHQNFSLEQSVEHGRRYKDSTSLKGMRDGQVCRHTWDGMS